MKIWFQNRRMKHKKVGEVGIGRCSTANLPIASGKQGSAIVPRSEPGRGHRCRPTPPRGRRCSRRSAEWTPAASSTGSHGPERRRRPCQPRLHAAGHDGCSGHPAAVPHRRHSWRSPLPPADFGRIPPTIDEQLWMMGRKVKVLRVEEVFGVEWPGDKDSYPV